MTIFARSFLLPRMTWLLLLGMTGGAVQQACAEEFGSVLIRSIKADAQVYIDGKLRGTAGTSIGDVPEGDHAIMCRQGLYSVFGTFFVRGGETLFLEARFEKQKLVLTDDTAGVPAPPKQKTIVARQEKPRKPAPLPPGRKESGKDPREERRKEQLTVIRVEFKDSEGEAVSVLPRTNPKTVSRYQEIKKQTGTYFRTKKNVLLCRDSHCEQQWSATFTYTDEARAEDNFSLTWKRTVFNGITPAGTSKRVLIFCLNNACRTLEDPAAADRSSTSELGRYLVEWKLESLVVRRADIVKEIADAGGTLGAYDHGP